MQFEWDENKRFGNLVKHGLDFFCATTAFDGRPYLELLSRHPEESR